MAISVLSCSCSVRRIGLPQVQHQDQVATPLLLELPDGQLAQLGRRAPVDPALAVARPPLAQSVVIAFQQALSPSFAVTSLQAGVDDLQPALREATQAGTHEQCGAVVHDLTATAPTRTESASPPATVRTDTGRVAAATRDTRRRPRTSRRHVRQHEPNAPLVAGRVTVSPHTILDHHHPRSKPVAPVHADDRHRETCSRPRPAAARSAAHPDCAARAARTAS